MDDRLPAHLEVAALIRAVNTEGGFAAVLSKGEPDAGTVMLVLLENGAFPRIYERMPQLDGSRAWNCTRREDPQDKAGFADYLDRRRAQDRDLWIVELDVAQPERFIGLTEGQG